MGMLDRVNQPSDLRVLVTEELVQLAGEIRAFLVENVSRTGGHLGPNLGVVELTIALHRVFDSPRDRIVFDTGHQSYVHKILTGRKDFSALRRRDGLTGYPSRAESPHDIVENSHASTALSWADGISLANRLAGRENAHVVAVIGDGAMTGGMAWEAINNISGTPNRNLVIVVNDNGRSYAPTIGGLAHHLDALRTNRRYEQVLDWGKRTLQSSGQPGRLMYDALHGMKKGVQDVLAPQGMFEGLGLKYIGPVDGHDIPAMEFALTRAKAYGGAVIVHAITEKGRGYQPALDDSADRFHAVGVIHPETGLPLVPARFGWTSVFSDEIVQIARERSDVVGVTAAMLEPVGLGPMAREFPERVIDVGIAEQHALTSAAGMAFAGLHPVVAVYATFLNRAYDQVLMDVALHQQAVTIILDRAGITGDDGPSHNGMWDLALMRTVPGLAVAAPRDEPSLRGAIRDAIAINGPTVVRFPKGAVPEPIPILRSQRAVDVLSEYDGEGRVLVVGIGPMARTACDVAAALNAQGIGSRAVSATWVLPVSDDLTRMAAQADLVVHIEDGIVEGGVGSALRDALANAGALIPVITHGIPRAFHHTSTRDELVEEFQLRPSDIARTVAGHLASRMDDSDRTLLPHEASGEDGSNS